MSCRIVRIAQYENRSLFHLVFEIIEVHVARKAVVVSVIVDKPALQHCAAIVPYRRKETVVYRCLYQYFIARLGHRLDCG